MNKEELARHRKALLKTEKNFDDKFNMITSNVGEHAYHTKLAEKKVHSTRDSLSYAVALLYAEEEKCTKRAVKIIEKILTLQDTDSASETFGLWPYFAEEPLCEMDAPDWNWADFLGKLLVEILYIHKDKLPQGLIEPIENACRYACESVIRRKLGIQYTNIAFMEALVTVSTGELLGEVKFFDYGCRRLEEFLEFYNYHGGVFEYNSPTYTFLVVDDVETFLRLVKNKKARKNAEKINDLCWKMIAEHFRSDMLRLAGPCSRAYSDTLPEYVLNDIEKACEGEVSFGRQYNDTTIWTKAYCPPKYRKYFKAGNIPKSSEKLIIRGFNYPFFAFAQTATTYHEKAFTIGSFNREELWNQRRPLLAYIKGEDSIYCLRARCLHDGYDFSSAVLHCVQEKSSLLGIVNFSCDRGDTHIGLDSAKDAEYKTLEVAFEIAGDTEKIKYKCNGNNAYIKIGATEVKINIPAVKFGGRKITYKIEKKEDKLILSALLYSGEKKKIKLKDLDAAYLCFAMSVNSEISEIEAKEDGEYIQIYAESFGKKLAVKALKSAEPFMNNMYYDLQTKDSQRLEDLARIGNKE